MCLRQESRSFSYQPVSQFFVDNIGTDPDLRTNLSGANPCEFVNGAKEFSFSEVEGMTILPPIWHRDLPSSVVFLGNLVFRLILFPPGAFSIWTVTISLLHSFVRNIWSLVTFVGADKGLSFSASFCPCRKVSKHIIAPTDSDLNNWAPLCLFWSFSISSDATEQRRCLMWGVERTVGLCLHLNSSNVASLKRRFLYQYNSGLKREFNWSHCFCPSYSGNLEEKR